MRTVRNSGVALLVALTACAGRMERAENPPPTVTATAPDVGPSVAPSAAPSPPPPVAAPIHPSSESDTVLFGVGALTQSGRLHDVESALLEPAMRAAYARMRADEDDPASLLRPRYDGTTLEYVPVGAPPRTVVVFLHGYGGAFALPCWQVARAAAAAKVGTSCPTLDVEAEWWSERGAAVLTREVSRLRTAGAERLVLVGLSNGAIGASRLLPKMPGVFAGSILISGADPLAAPPGVPALVVQGRRDTMMSASAARTYATAAHARYLEVDHGHFAMLLGAAEVDAAVGAFVSERAR